MSPATPLLHWRAKYWPGSASNAKLTLLAGHDTNIADVAGFFRLHWKVMSYPADDVPPGGALGFEVIRDFRGARFVRVFFRAQTMDQLRNQEPLVVGFGPMRQYPPNSRLWRQYQAAGMQAAGIRAAGRGAPRRHPLIRSITHAARWCALRSHAWSSSAREMKLKVFGPPNADGRVEQREQRDEISCA